MSARGASGRIDAINIALMVISAAAAIAAPFHVFLFAYAVLGPLHYLTEISWLHDRSFFTPRASARSKFLLLVAGVAAVMAYGFVSTELLHRPVKPTFEIGLFLFVFLAAVVALYVKHPVNAAAVIVVAGTAIALFSGHPAYGIIAYLLITLIHVFVFTGCFILYGALKSKSATGIASLAVFIAAALVTLLARAPWFAPSPSVRVIYAAFEQLNVILLRAFGHPAAAIYANGGVGVMRFIAFAYTYHYLNWFSKTSIIGWHAVTRLRAAAIVGLWLAGIVVYIVDYRIGFAVFYVLSAAHVMLEFPLNHQTFAGLSRELSALFGRLWPSQSA